MNTKTTNPLRRYQIFFAVLAAFCVVAIAVNVIVRQGPVRDATSEADLSSISAVIDAYAMSQGMLPSGLERLSGLSSATQKRLAGYDYAPIGPSQYQLCATFATVGSGQNIIKPYAPGSAATDTTRHGKGRECFTYQVSGYGPLGRPVPVGR